jgi:hypothetical protein
LIRRWRRLSQSYGSYRTQCEGTNTPIVTEIHEFSIR